MHRALAYFGLDGSATRRDSLHASVEVLPPIVVAALAASLDGVGGLVGAMLGFVYAVAAIVVWVPLVRRVGPTRRR